MQLINVKLTLTDKTLSYNLRTLVQTYITSLGDDLVSIYRAKHLKIQFDPDNITSKYYIGGVSTGKLYLGGQETDFGPFPTPQVELGKILLNCDEDAKTINVTVIP